MKYPLINPYYMRQLLSKLDPYQVPYFGILTPQHMVEHLIDSVQYSNGVISGTLVFSEERANFNKQYLIYSDAEMPKGIKRNKNQEVDVLSPLVHPDLSTAIDALIKEIENFSLYFIKQPNAVPIQPMLGALTKAEWEIFHHKHLSHHFKQFGLI